MPPCYCDRCTRWGRHPQGSIQSETTARKHQKQHKTWNAHRTNTSGPGAQVLQGLMSSQRQQSPDRDSDAPAVLDSNIEIQTLLDHIRGRILNFQLPVELVFAYPPRTPESVYTLTRHSDPWDVGPSSLDITAPQNGSILDHVRFIQETNEQLQSQLLGSCPPSSELAMLSHVLTSELARVEGFREKMWNKQIEANSPMTSSSWNDYIVTPLTCETRTCHLLASKIR